MLRWIGTEHVARATKAALVRLRRRRWPDARHVLMIAQPRSHIRIARDQREGHRANCDYRRWTREQRAVVRIRIRSEFRIPNVERNCRGHGASRGSINRHAKRVQPAKEIRSLVS